MRDWPEDSYENIDRSNEKNKLQSFYVKTIRYFLLVTIFF